MQINLEQSSLKEMNFRGNTNFMHLWISYGKYIEHF